MTQPSYSRCDLKSYYASVECVERGLDPLNTRLVVADETRGDGTICLAVSPALKALGVPGRPRLFEVKRILADHERRTGEHIDFIIAPPQMRLYEEISAKIVGVYMDYVSPGDCHVYSIDECFFDLSGYLPYYKVSAHELMLRMIRSVLRETGITATAGIGPNPYLAKVCMDIVAKHIPADQDGVRIAELDEQGFREKLWGHEPITDFWRIGPRIANRLAAKRIYTMGDMARATLIDEDWFYREFGVDGELMIDHAWGLESCTMADIKAFRPSSNSMSSGQVLFKPYPYQEAETVVREMAELLVYDMMAHMSVTNSVSVDIGFDSVGMEEANYRGRTYVNHLGKVAPYPVHGSEKLLIYTDSVSMITEAALGIFRRIMPPKLFARQIHITFSGVLHDAAALHEFNLLIDHAALELEKRKQTAILNIREQYGKNAILTGTNFMDGATTRHRNEQIGGHRAG